MRTAGAIWTTVTVSGSSMARSTAWTSSRSRNAPTGQWVMHWPHSEQSASRMVRFSDTLTRVWLPVATRSQTFRLWTLSQIWMQRIHSMHLVVSRIRGKVRSQRRSFSAGRFSRKGLDTRPRSLDRVCSSQLPLRTQRAHLESCRLRISCRLVRRASRTRALLVWMAMPSATTLLQAGMSLSSPSTSTQHSRQAPISLIPFR